MPNDSTGLKVEIAFGCLIALLIGVGWLGLSRMGAINDTTTRLFDERWERLYTTRSAISYFNTNSRILMRFSLGQDQNRAEVDAIGAELTANNSKASAAWAVTERKKLPAEERELLEKVLTTKVPADESLQRTWNHIAQEGKTQDVNRVMESETLPLLFKYRDAFVALTDYQEAQLNQASVQSKASYDGVRRLSTTLILLAIALAVCIAAFVTDRLSREMKERAKAQQSISSLNEDLEKKVKIRTDELNRTVAALQEEANVRRLQESDLRRLAAIVESSDDAIIAITLNGTITDWNPGAERMLGYAQNEIVGQPISKIIPPDRLGEPNRSLLRFIEGEHVIGYETVRVHKDGHYIHVSMTISPMRDAQGQVIGGSAIFRDITERKTMEDALRRSEAGFRSLVQNAPYGILRTMPDGKIVQANPALVQMLGYDFESELLGLNMNRDLCRYPDNRLDSPPWGLLPDSARGVEVEWKRKDGSSFTVRCDTHVVMATEGFLEFLETFVEDITERRELEVQLRQRQKMEAIGRLAGGVAHDFNNLLGVITGYSELLSEKVGAESGLHNSIEQIRKAADRAAALTRQLLAFSRQQVLETKILNLNLIVEEMITMLPRLLGEDIELRTALDPNLGSVRADGGQIEQVLMNLAVNARDAMPGGGELSIRTARVRFTSELALKHPAMVPGRYVLLSVRDNGTGMDKQTQARIFEPFFTTKERGRGTGLGLAMVYGFVKQIGGYIWVESAPGEGSTFEIYLPMVGDAAPRNTTPAAAPFSRHAAGTVLLVEDEESLRTLTRNILEQSGYTVIEACQGAEAVEMARDHSERIDLLLTDMVMPGLGGRAVAEQVKRLHPGIHVAYMSGYTGFTTQETGTLDGVIIAKPFTRDVLLQKLSEALESAHRPTQT